MPFTFLLLLNFKILTSFRRLKSRINNNKKKVSHANSTGLSRTHHFPLNASCMIVTNFLLNTIKISGADWLSPPCLHVHNPNQNKNCVAIYSLNLSGNVASAEPGCQHVPGPHLHRGRVPPLSHSQVLGDYNILNQPPNTISILILSID